MTFLTKYSLVDSAIVFSSIIILAYLYMTRKFKYWKNRGVTEMKPTPFIGNFGDHLIGKCSVGEWLRDLYEYGTGLPYLGFYILDKPCLLICDPGLVKNILVRDFNFFYDRYATASTDEPLGERNLFLIKNPAWKLLRSKIAPIYTTGKLKKMFELMVEIGDDLDTYMDVLSLDGNGKTLEVKEIFAKFSTDMIGSTAYGIKVNSLNNPDAEFRKHGKSIFESTLVRYTQLLSIFFVPGIVKPLGFKFFPNEVSRFLRKVMWDVMRERERSGTKRHDLIDILIELKNAHHERAEKEIFEFDGDNLVAQTATFFVGGFETSSTALSFACYELALQPEIQSRLRKEIITALRQSEGKITYEMVMSLSYLDMVVAETLRKYPVLPFLDRIANGNYKVPNSDFVIEKGTPIFIPVLGLHYDPQYFPDPHKFDPERFSAENKKSMTPCVYLPFGDGPHICIGMRIGLLQMMLGLIKMLSKYEFSPCNETSIPMRLSKTNFTTTPEGGVFLNVKQIVDEQFILE